MAYATPPPGRFSIVVRTSDVDSIPGVERYAIDVEGEVHVTVSGALIVRTSSVEGDGLQISRTRFIFAPGQWIQVRAIDEKEPA